MTTAPRRGSTLNGRSATVRIPSIASRVAAARTRPWARECGSAYAATFFQSVVEHVAQLMGASAVLAGDGLVFALEHLVLVGDVQRGEHGQPQRVDRRGLLGHGAHLRVHVLCELEDVIGIGPAQVVGLVVNLHTDAVAVTGGRL